MSTDKDMMMLRFKTAIDRELKRTDGAASKPPRAPNAAPAPRTPPTVRHTPKTKSS